MPALRGGMILYSRRSAKSVACSRLNVIGVSAFFFLPLFVAALTSADEFHSVTNTRCPSAISHFASRPSCVVFPDPSMPSTTNSFPGYSCGVVRLFNMTRFAYRASSTYVTAHLDAQRLANHPFEGGGMSRRRPELQFRVAGRPQLEQPVVAAVVQLEVGHRLRMAAVEALGQPEDCGQRPDRPAAPAAELAVLLVPSLRRRLPVIPGDERDDLDLLRVEASQIPIFDQIVRMLVMALVADVYPDVVQKRGIFEPFALAVGQAVDNAGLVEQGDGQPCHLLRVLGPVVAALGELEHAAASYVGIPVGLGDLLAVTADVVEDEAFPQ